MSLTILGGQAAAFMINLPTQVKFRPTSVMLRRKLFDAHQSWAGECFFDVCAGSGAMGMEAWSRGAESFFAEVDKFTLKLLAANLNKFRQRLGQSGGVNQVVENEEGQDYLAEHLINNQHREDFGLGRVASFAAEKTKPLTIFFDPPYEALAELLPPFWAHLKKIIWAELWIESDRQKGLTEAQIMDLLGQNFVLSAENMAAQAKTVAAGTNFIVKVRAKSHNADAR